MQHYNQGYDELYHYGVYGMKWGQRRFAKDQDRRIKADRRLNKNNPDHKSFKEKTNREKMKEAFFKIKEEERSFTMKQQDDRIYAARIDYQAQRRNMDKAWDNYKKTGSEASRKVFEKYANGNYKNAASASRMTSGEFAVMTLMSTMRTSAANNNHGRNRGGKSNATL